MRAAIAAAKVEAEVGSVEDGDDASFTVSGFVSWNPLQQEWSASGVRVEATHRPGNEGEIDTNRGGELPNATWLSLSEEALIAEAEKNLPELGRCVGCVLQSSAWRMATGPDWFCNECRGAAQARAA